MAEGRLTYNLNHPDDAKAFQRAVNADKMASFIWELRNNVLRNAYKNDLPANVLIELINEELKELPFDINDLWV